MRKLLYLLPCILAAGGVLGQAARQNKRPAAPKSDALIELTATLDARDLTFQEALAKLQTTTRATIQVEAQPQELQNRVTLHLLIRPVSEILKAILEKEGSGLRFRRQGSVYTIYRPSFVEEPPAETVDDSTELVLKLGHSDKITGVQFGPPGSDIAATGGAEGRTIIWNLDGTPQRMFQGRMVGGGLSRNGKRIVVADGNEVKVFSTITGELLAPRKFKDTVAAASFAAASDVLVASVWDETLHIWQQNGEGEHVKISTPGAIYRAVPSPDGSMVAGYITAERTVEVPKKKSDNMVIEGKGITIAENHRRERRKKFRIWDGRTGAQLRIAEAAGQIFAAAFSPDGSTLATLSDPFVLELWDARSGGQIRTLMRTNDGAWHGEAALAFSPDGRQIAVGGNGAGLRILDVGSGEQVEQLALPQDARTWPTVAAAFSADGKRLISGLSCWVGNPNKLTLWDLAAGKQIDHFGKDAGTQADAAFGWKRPLLACAAGTRVNLWDLKRGGNPASLNAQAPIAFLPGDEYLATIGEQREKVIFWATDTGRQVASVNHGAGIATIALTKGGGILATGGDDRVIKLWDVSTLKELFRLPGHTGRVQKLIFSPMENALASIGDAADKEIHIWNVATGKELFQVKSESGWIRMDAVSFHPSGQTVACEIKGHTAIYRVSDGQKLIDVPEQAQSPVFTSEDQLVTEWGGDISVWGMDENGGIQRMARFPGAGAGASPVINQDGTQLVSRSGDNRKLRIWRFGKRVSSRISVLPTSVEKVAFSADHRLVATVCSDDSVRLWSPSGSELVRITSVGDDDFIMHTPENYYLATRGALRVVKFKKEGQTYPFEQFDIQLHRPDIVLSRLGYAPRPLIESMEKTYRRRLKKMGLPSDKEFKLDFHLPKAELSKVEPSTSAQTIEIEAKFSDSKYKLDRYMVWDNGVPVGPTGGTPVQPANASTAAVRITVPLLSGDNKIQVSVTNSNNVESLRVERKVNCTATVAKPDLYVIAIGASDYKEASIPKLKFAAKDAQDLSRVLSRLALKTEYLGRQPAPAKPPAAAANASRPKSAQVSKAPAKKPSRRSSRRRRSRTPQPTFVSRPPTPAAPPKLYSTAHILLLDGDMATRENILKARELLTRTSVEDSVITFISGHGDVDEDLKYFFLPYDAPADRKKYQGAAVSYDEIEGLFEGVSARRRLILMDTCCSGEVDAGDLNEASATGPAPPTTSDTPKGVKLTRRSVSLKGDPPSMTTSSLRTIQRLLQETFVDLRRGAGAAVISSAGGVEASLEGDKWNNGAFTYAILEGIVAGKADAEHQGFVTASKLEKWVAKRVPELTENAQLPTTRRENFEMDFRIY